MTKTLGLALAQAVGERVLDPATRDTVTIFEMEDACLAVARAQAAGAIEAETEEAFFALVKQVIPARVNGAAESWQDAAAWVAMKRAARALPSGALSRALN